MNRGSDLGEIDGGAALLASMRPRFMNRGSVKTSRNAGSAWVLQ